MVYDKDKYLQAAHKIQTAVALDITASGENDAGASPKHLRVGLNMIMRDHATLVELLVSKGVFTADEYLDAMADGTIAEANQMRERLVKKGIIAEGVEIG